MSRRITGPRAGVGDDEAVVTASPDPAARAARDPAGVTRRALPGAVGVGLGGLAAGAVAGYAAAAQPPAGEPDLPGVGGVPTAGSAVEPFRGVHQAGIATPAQAHARYVALDLRPGVDRPALVRLMPAWLTGGTALVIRRIAMDLRTWGGLGTDTKEQSIGRRLADGAPLTGGTEQTAPDYQALDANGFPVIPATSHIRLAHPQNPGERILRRPYNYDDGTAADGLPDAGLIFVACMADPIAQFVPIQQRLAQADVLNLWTTPIGSALFAVPPGVQPGQHLGQSLLDN